MDRKLLSYTNFLSVICPQNSFHLEAPMQMNIFPLKNKADSKVEKMKIFGRQNDQGFSWRTNTNGENWAFIELIFLRTSWGSEGSCSAWLFKGRSRVDNNSAWQQSTHQAKRSSCSFFVRWQPVRSLLSCRFEFERKLWRWNELSV